MGALARYLFGDVAPAEVTAAAGTVALARNGAGGHAAVPYTFGPPLAPFTFPAGDLLDRDAAVSLPTIQRCRDLIVSAVSALPLTMWKRDLAAVPIVEQQVPGPTWFERPDPDRTRQDIVAWTVDDLFFYGAAHWEVTGRYADTFPSAFRRVGAGNLSVRNDGTAEVTDPDGKRRTVDARDLVEFLSPLTGVLATGWRAISIALQLDAAADRFAGTEVPAGVLEEQEGSEDMTADELAALADRFTRARQTNTTAAVNKYVRYRETHYDASAMQLVEGRTYQALELARLGNVPAYLVGAPTGTGMTYQNALQAKGDLIDFGAAPLIACIEQTLSGPNVTPRGQIVRFDQNAWLRNPFTTPANAVESPNDLQVADPTTSVPVP